MPLPGDSRTATSPSSSPSAKTPSSGICKVFSGKPAHGTGWNLRFSPSMRFQKQPSSLAAHLVLTDSPDEWLAARAGGKLLYHCQQQLAVTLIQIRRVAADLSQEADFILAQLRDMFLVMTVLEHVIGEKLSQRNIHRRGYLCQRVERWNRMSIL